MILHLVADMKLLCSKKGANAKLMVEILIVLYYHFWLKYLLVDDGNTYIYKIYACEAYISYYLPFELVLAVIKLWKMPLAKVISTKMDELSYVKLLYTQKPTVCK